MIDNRPKNDYYLQSQSALYLFLSQVIHVHEILHQFLCWYYIIAILTKLCFIVVVQLPGLKFSLIHMCYTLKYFHVHVSVVFRMVQAEKRLGCHVLKCTYGTLTVSLHVV